MDSLSRTFPDGTPRAPGYDVLLAHVDTIEDPVAAASAVSLRYVTDDAPGITRRKHGKSFTYLAPDGRVIRDERTLARIRALAVPPAWTNVWIATDPNGHIQATGRDARGRKQYRYHAKWTEVRNATKYHRLVEFVRVLPKIRVAVTRDLSCTCLCKSKVLATIVSLMEKAQLRVGNEEYARQNGSYGATTLRTHHAKFRGTSLELAFRGKAGVQRKVVVRDARLTRIVRQCHDLPGKRLFQYVDEAGEVHPITSADVNEYLQDISGGPFTAKDYRTWAATMGAALLLCALEYPGSERACKSSIKRALEQVAARLGHTVAICRASYVHPRLLADFSDNKLARLAKRIRGHVQKHSGDFENIDVAVFRAIEPAVARYLAS